MGRALIVAAILAALLTSAAFGTVTWSTITGPVTDPTDARNQIGTNGTALYVVFNNNTFYKYTFTQGQPTTGTWTQLTTPPRSVCTGDSYSDMAYQNGYLYTCAVSTSGLRTVLRYNISGSTWQIWQNSGVDLDICNTTGNGLYMDPAQDGVGISVWHAGNYWVEFNWTAKTADNGWMSTSGLPVLDPHWVCRCDDVATDGSGHYYATHNDWTQGLSSGDCLYTWTGATKGATPSLLKGKPWKAGFGQSIEFIPGTMAPSGHNELWLARGAAPGTQPHEGWGTASTDWARIDLSNLAAGWTTGTLPGTVGYSGEVTLINGSVFVRGTTNKWYVTMLSSNTHNPISMKQAKGVADTNPVEVQGAVTAIFPGDPSFNVESTNRGGGIQVRYSATPPAMNEVVYVNGHMDTDPTTRERCLHADGWSTASTPKEIRPLAMAGKNVGGGAMNLQEATAGGVGLNDVGMLVRTWGKVTSVASDNSYFFASDGSATSPVKADMSAFVRLQRPEPTTSDYVCATGICSMYDQAGQKRPMLRARSASDIQIQGDDGNRPKTFQVLVVNLDPIIESNGGLRLHQVLGWNDPHPLADGYLSDLETSSGGWAKYRVAQWIDADYWAPLVDGFAYTDAGFLYAWTHGGPWHSPQGVDYYNLIDHFDMDSRVKSGEIDEVWVFGAPYMGFYESQMAGPGSYWCNSPGLPTVDSGRIFVIMGFNYERGIGEMLEDYGHRAESIMTHVYGSWHNTYPPQHNWDKFTLYNQISSGHAACGNVHYAPNSTADYQWGNTSYVWSTCDDWLYNWPNLQGDSTKRWMNCSEWGNGDIRLHHNWWFNHFPRKPGVNPDGKQNNWWKYLADFNSYPESR